jgi:hypothetical protein
VVVILSDEDPEVLVSPLSIGSSATRWKAELLTSKHNGDNGAEIERVLNEHPEEPAAVADGRVLGVLAPFRSKWIDYDPIYAPDQS